MGFHDGYFSRAGAFTLDIDRVRHVHRLRIPLSSSLADYDEGYRLSPGQYDAFVSDPPSAKRFADQCRRREHDDLLIGRPGRNRGTPRLPDESDAVQAAIMLLDTFTSFPRGVALGVDVRSGGPYLSVPAGVGHSPEEWRYFLISPTELTSFEADIDAAVDLADACRRGDHADRLITLPKPDRGEPQ